MWEVMAEFGAVTTPRAKRRTILGSIARFEKRLAQAQADLSRANARLARPRRQIRRGTPSLSEVSWFRVQPNGFFSRAQMA
jgi:hypothetical protein